MGLLYGHEIKGKIASADFSTPIGYQTHLMAWNRGDYRFLDYTRFGLPLQLLLLVISVVVISLTGDMLGSPDISTNATVIRSADDSMSAYFRPLFF